MVELGLAAAILATAAVGWGLSHRYGHPGLLFGTAAVWLGWIVMPRPVMAALVFLGVALLAANGILRVVLAWRAEPERGLPRWVWVAGQFGVALGLLGPAFAVTTGEPTRAALILLATAATAVCADLMLARGVPVALGLGAELVAVVVTLLMLVGTGVAFAGVAFAALSVAAAVSAWRALRPRAAGANANRWFAAAAVLLLIGAVVAPVPALGFPAGAVTLATAWSLLAFSWRRSVRSGTDGHVGGTDCDCCAHDSIAVTN